MTISQQDAEVQVGMSLEDFLEAQEDQAFEILDGERVDKMPNVFGHTWYIRILFLALYNHAVQHNLGEVFTESTYVQLTGKDWVKGARIPDIVFYSHERIAAFKAETTNWLKRPLHLAPDLTIEVLSPTERAADITKKWRVDLSSGVRALWTVDIENEVVMVYRGEQARLLTRADVLDGEDVLPGFRLPLSDLFKQEDSLS